MLLLTAKHEVRKRRFSSKFTTNGLGSNPKKKIAHRLLYNISLIEYARILLDLNLSITDSGDRYYRCS